MRSYVTTGAAAVSLGLLLSGCQVKSSNDVGLKPPTSSAAGSAAAAGPAVPRAQVEKITAEQISKSDGMPIDVSCPEDLPMRLGATEQCTAMRDGKRYEVAITVNKADPPMSANWDWKVVSELEPTG